MTLYYGCGKHEADTDNQYCPICMPLDNQTYARNKKYYTGKQFYPPDYGPQPGQIVKKEDCDIVTKQAVAIRKFETGATRDTAEGKYEYNGFNSPLVEKRFAEYMHLHRHQSDGQLRDSGNWKHGIPEEEYLKSMHRHFVDLWLIMDGFKAEARDQDIESVLCAIRFNVNGLLHEELKKKPAG
jgi:hypothetical protein